MAFRAFMKAKQGLPLTEEEEEAILKNNEMIICNFCGNLF